MLEERRLSADEFRDVIGHFASGVTIVTATEHGAPLGTTASAVCSLSLEPPMVVICMNRTSQTGQAITRVGRFAINVLAEHQQPLARHFASKDPDKFSGLDTTAGTTGAPLLDEAVAHLECTVTEEVEGGTHTVFLAEVRAATAHGGAPLAYFRGAFGRLQEVGPPAWEAVEAALDERFAAGAEAVVAAAAAGPGAVRAALWAQNAKVKEAARHMLDGDTRRS